MWIAATIAAFVLATAALLTLKACREEKRRRRQLRQQQSMAEKTIATGMVLSSVVAIVVPEMQIPAELYEEDFEYGKKTIDRNNTGP